MTKQKIIKDKKGNEQIMIRVDKTLKEMLEEKLSSRWDVKYWHPKYEKIMQAISNKWDVDELGDYIHFITYGQVGSRKYDPKGDVFYIQTKNILNTGISYHEKFAKVKENSHNDPARSRLKKRDLLLANAGMGAIGKAAIFLNRDRVNISQDLDILRFKKISPFYVLIFLKTIFGNSQLWRRTRGVGAPKLPFDEIKHIQIPIIDEDIQKDMEKKVILIHALHNEAIGGTVQSKDNKKKLQKAEKLLANLIEKTEAVIRGNAKTIS